MLFLSRVRKFVSVFEKFLLLQARFYYSFRTCATFINSHDTPAASGALNEPISHTFRGPRAQGRFLHDELVCPVQRREEFQTQFFSKLMLISCIFPESPVRPLWSYEYFFVSICAFACELELTRLNSLPDSHVR